jgi:hypothetical protein
MNKREGILTIGVTIGIVSLLLIGAVILAFLRLDFSTARSETNAQHTLSTSTISQPDRTIVLARGISVSTANREDDILSMVLLENLVAQLQMTIPVDQVTIVDASVEEIDQPLLRVEVSQRNIHWNPFVSTASLTVELTYSSDGDIRWRQNSSIQMRNDESKVYSHGTAQISDRTQGIMSQIAYEKHLGRSVAAEIYKMIEQPLFNPPG